MSMLACCSHVKRSGRFTDEPVAEFVHSVIGDGTRFSIAQVSTSITNGFTACIATPSSKYGGAGVTPEQFANSLCGRSPAETPARAAWKNTKTEEKNEDPKKPEDLSLSV